MIIVDMNQVMIANLMAQIGNHTNIEISENLLRHMVLNTIRGFKNKFGSKYGDLVFACDDKKYWRKEFYPYYKAHRKVARQKSELDWTALFAKMDKIKQELIDNFPYKIMQIAGAEADDIIGTLCQEYGVELMNSTTEYILILSADKDFIQLQVNANVEQYDPIRNRWIKSDSPQGYLLEHIARGDRGDGIPNVLSKDDCFINSRQRPLRKKMLEEILNCVDDIKINEEITRNWVRNKTLIDLNYVPQNIKKSVIDTYINSSINKRDKLFNYFVEYKLKNLMENIGEF